MITFGKKKETPDPPVEGNTSSLKEDCGAKKQTKVASQKGARNRKSRSLPLKKGKEIPLLSILRRERERAQHNKEYRDLIRVLIEERVKEPHAFTGGKKSRKGSKGTRLCLCPKERKSGNRG